VNQIVFLAIAQAVYIIGAKIQVDGEYYRCVVHLQFFPIARFFGPAVFVAFVYNIIGVKFFDAGGAKAVAETSFRVFPDIGLDLIPKG